MPVTVETTVRPNIENLRNLRKAVESAPPELFDMRTFAQATACGTSACAFGWYADKTPGTGLFLDPKSGMVRQANGEEATEDFRCDHFGFTYDDEGALFYPVNFRDEDREAPADWLIRFREWASIHAPAALND